MNSFKKILSFLLVATMLLGIAPVMALATEGSGDPKPIEWKIEGTTLTFTGKDAMRDYDENNPSPWANENSIANVTTVVFSEGITSIGKGTFSGLTKLTTIKIPISVSSINDAFSSLPALESFIVDAENPAYSAKDGILFNKAGDTILSYPAAKDVETLKLTKDITAIDANAFANCSKIQNIQFYGTKAEWEAVKIGANNDIIKNAAVSCMIDSINVTVETDIAALFCSEHEKYVAIETEGLSFHVRPDGTAIDRIGVSNAERYKNGEYTLNLLLDVEEMYEPDETLTKATVNGTAYDIKIEGNLITIQNIKVTVSGIAEDHQHKYDRAETKPTCETNGTVTYTCEICKDSYKGNPVDKLGHTWSEWSYNEEEHTHVCQTEGCTKSVTSAHRFSDWTSDGNRGIFKNGTESQYCYDCKYSVTRVEPESSFVVRSLKWLAGYFAFSAMGAAEPFHILYNLAKKIFIK